MFEKKCCSCKELRLISEFCKNKNSNDGLSVQCRICAKLYREANKDKNYSSSSPEYKKVYYSENKDKINSIRRKNYHENVAFSRNKARERYTNNTEIIKAYNSKWYFENKEYNSNRNKIYRENNKQAIYLRNRRREKKISSINIYQKEIDNLLKFYENKCFYCKIEIKPGINLHLDHKMPLSRGGLHSIDNLVPACASCNLRKGTKTDIEFIQRLNNVS